MNWHFTYVYLALTCLSCLPVCSLQEKTNVHKHNKFWEGQKICAHLFFFIICILLLLNHWLKSVLYVCFLITNQNANQEAAGQISVVIPCAYSKGESLYPHSDGVTWAYEEVNSFI